MYLQYIYMHRNCQFHDGNDKWHVPIYKVIGYLKIVRDNAPFPEVWHKKKHLLVSVRYFKWCLEFRKGLRPVLPFHEIYIYGYLCILLIGYLFSLTHFLGMGPPLSHRPEGKRKRSTGYAPSLLLVGEAIGPRESTPLGWNTRSLSTTLLPPPGTVIKGQRGKTRSCN